jgi:hypothetical protein
MKTLYLLVTAFCLSLIPLPGHAFSVLTHEALVDANWSKVILPILKEKYPLSTDDELKKARAFAYGGAVAPDMGYYPFGSKLFTNLVHYVRSGDFIETLFKEEKNLNEYAFALGVLCHYMADKYGHPLATNKSVPIVYPDVRKKYGNEVTYAEDKVSHLRMEFAFDVLQTARGNYASQDYHNYIGFQVADTLLATAFASTYGLEITDVFSNFNRALGTFRWTVKNLFPEITKAAWVNKKKEIKKSQPGATGRKFIYRMQRNKYVNEFGNEREKPGLLPNILSFVIRILPKIGPLKTLKFKIPGPEAEKLFIQGFDTVLAHYTVYVGNEMPVPAHLEDVDFDTGKRTALGEYALADQTYKDLLQKLQDKKFEQVSPALRENIIAFYKNQGAHIATANPEDWEEINQAIDEMKKSVNTGN